MTSDNTDIDEITEEGGSDDPPSSVVPHDPEGSGDTAVQLPMFATTFSLTEGPIPAPEAMRRYDDIDPSIRESIMVDFNRRSEEAANEAAHRRELDRHFMRLEERELELRVEESGHSRKVGNRASTMTPIYIVGSLVALVVIALFAPLDGFALASVLISAIIGGCIIIATAIMRGPVGEDEGRTITSLATSIAKISGQRPTGNGDGTR